MFNHVSNDFAIRDTYAGYVSGDGMHSGDKLSAFTAESKDTMCRPCRKGGVRSSTFCVVSYRYSPPKLTSEFSILPSKLKGHCYKPNGE